MQEFSSADSRHEFSVDGRQFYLPLPSIDDVMMFTSLGELPTPLEQAAGMRRALVERARPVKATWWERLIGYNPAVKALGSLDLRQTSALFTGWATAGGLQSGESSGSAD